MYGNTSSDMNAMLRVVANVLIQIPSAVQQDGTKVEGGIQGRAEQKSPRPEQGTG